MSGPNHSTTDPTPAPRRERYVSVEEPDTTVRIDFLGAPGASVTVTRATDARGRTTLHVFAMEDPSARILIDTLTEIDS